MVVWTKSRRMEYKTMINKSLMRMEEENISTTMFLMIMLKQNKTKLSQTITTSPPQWPHHAGQESTLSCHGVCNNSVTMLTLLTHHQQLLRWGGGKQRLSGATLPPVVEAGCSCGRGSCSCRRNTDETDCCKTEFLPLYSRPWTLYLSMWWF